MRPLWSLFVMTLAACSSGVNVAPPAADDDVSSLGADPPSGSSMLDDDSAGSDDDTEASSSDDMSSDTRPLEAGVGADDSSDVDVADESPDDATDGSPADDDDATNDDDDAIVQADDADARDNSAPSDDGVLDDEPSTVDDDDDGNVEPDDAVVAGKDAGSSRNDDTGNDDTVDNPPECQGCVTSMEVTPELDGVKQHSDPRCGEYRVASLTKFLVTPETRENDSRFLILVRELLEDSTVGSLAVEVAEGHTLPDWLTLSISPLGHVTLRLDEEFYGPGEAAADVWVQHSGDTCPALLVPFEIYFTE